MPPSKSARDSPQQFAPVASRWVAFDKFTRLPTAEKRLLPRAVLLVVTVRLGLSLLPFHVVHRRVENATRRALNNAPAKKVSPLAPMRLAWAIGAVSQRIPSATCLTQALAAQLLLARYGYASQLRIGVAKDDGNFKAHAWLESQNQIVIGDSGLDEFTVLPEAPDISQSAA